MERLFARRTLGLVRQKRRVQSELAVLWLLMAASNALLIVHKNSLYI